MGKLKQQLIELEEAGVIEWSIDENMYLRVDVTPPTPFDLADYLAEQEYKK